MTTDSRLGPRAIATSAATYAAAFLATTILHELAHFVVAVAFDRHPVLFHNAVESAPAGTLATVATSLAGPVFSAVQGLALVVVERRTRHLSPVLRLGIVWLAFHGLMNATGYTFTTSFVPDADMGKAARLVGIPTVGLIAISALGFWLIRVAAKGIYPGFVALAPRSSRSEVGARNRALVRIALAAWPLGVVLVVPASLPVPHWISLVYVVIAGVGAVWFTDFSKAEPDAPAPSGEALPDRIAIAPLVIWAVLVAVCVGVLRGGITLGD